MTPGAQKSSVAVERLSSSDLIFTYLTNSVSGGDTSSGILCDSSSLTTPPLAGSSLTLTGLL